MSRKINTRDLVNKIEKITRAKMLEQEVVSLDQFREFKKKMDPKVLLIVEDDETMRVALKRIFEAEGYVVKLVADGTQLSGVLDDSPIDLIMLDIGLPWIDGFELGKLMKENRDLKKIPLLYVSGNSSEEDVRRAFEIGADDFVKKPFDIDKIKKTVKTLLKLGEQA